jgi:hypothetical protein
MHYPSGKTVAIGDPVWWNEGVNVGRVSAILESNEQYEPWGLEEPGVFVCFDFSGKTMTEDAFTPEKDLEGEGLDVMNEEEEREIQELFARYCLANPSAKDYSFTVLLHNAYMGIKILELFREATIPKIFCALYAGSTEFVPISEKEALGIHGVLSARPGGGGPAT